MTTSLLADLNTRPVLWEVDGIVAAPVAAVAGLLFAVEDGRVGDDNLLVLAGSSAARRGAMTVRTTRGGYRADGPIDIEVAGAIAVRSWYGGVHEVMPAPTGTRVVHRVHQVLPDHPGFAAGVAEIGVRTRLARDLRRVLTVIADRLDC
jgi:hypothetical protein